MSAKPFYPGKYIIYCTATGGPDNTEETESCYILSLRGERSSITQYFRFTQLGALQHTAVGLRQICTPRISYDKGLAAQIS